MFSLFLFRIGQIKKWVRSSKMTTSRSIVDEITVHSLFLRPSCHNAHHTHHLRPLHTRPCLNNCGGFGPSSHPLLWGLTMDRLQCWCNPFALLQCPPMFQQRWLCFVLTLGTDQTSNFFAFNNTVTEAGSFRLPLVLSPLLPIRLSSLAFVSGPCRTTQRPSMSFRRRSPFPCLASPVMHVFLGESSPPTGPPDLRPKFRALFPSPAQFVPLWGLFIECWWRV